MSYRYSLHAIEQLKIRGLIQSVVEDVLNSPDKVVPDAEGVNIYQKLVIENNKPYLYRVLVNINKQPPMVITV